MVGGKGVPAEPYRQRQDPRDPWAGSKFVLTDGHRMGETVHNSSRAAAGCRLGEYRDLSNDSIHPASHGPGKQCSCVAPSPPSPAIGNLHGEVIAKGKALLRSLDVPQFREAEETPRLPFQAPSGKNPSLRTLCLQETVRLDPELPVLPPKAHDPTTLDRGTQATDIGKTPSGTHKAKSKETA